MKKHSAFTLVELLVVISIIGVLLLMVLPAVQMVREAGRRTSCANKVRQLALALMSYESAHEQLPIGLRSFEFAVGSSSTQIEANGMTWITRILPFVEQNTMWEHAMEDYRADPIPFRSHRGMQTVLQVVSCPSDPSSGKLHWTHEGYLVACTNYLGVNGTNFKTRDGVFTYDKPVQLNEIIDGQSNTLLIGERPPSPDFWYGWWYATGQGAESTGDVTLGVAELKPVFPSGRTNHLDACMPGPYTYEAGRHEQCDTLHFWSDHPGGANFALADGSVHMIPYTIDDSIIQGLATRSGGEVLSTDF